MSEHDSTPPAPQISQARQQRTHAPKVSALRAEAAGLLSGPGRDRLLRHVADCEVCAEHLRGARRFHALVARATGQPLLDVGPSLQRAVARERLSRTRTRATWGGLGLAAAIVLFGLAFMLGEPEPRASAPDASPITLDPPRVAMPEAAELSVVITALAGQATLANDGAAPQPLSMQSQLRESSVLQTGEPALLDLAIATVGAMRLGAGSELRLRRIRSDGVALELQRGELSSDVEPRSAGQSYEVLARGHRVAVRGTRFAVRASDETGLAVQVDTGAVEVFDPSGASIAVLSAPASWHERPGAAAVLRAPRPHAQHEGDVLELPAQAQVDAWELGGGETFPAAVAVHLRLPVGAVSLTAQLGDGRSRVIPIELQPLGTRVEPSDLQFDSIQPTRAARTAPREGAQDPAPVTADASSVILAGRPALQRCYERSLKNESSGSQLLLLRIALDARGSVKRVTPTSQREGVELPPELSRCIRAAVMDWRFAPPGGDDVVIDAPLRFQLRRP